MGALSFCAYCVISSKLAVGIYGFGSKPHTLHQIVLLNSVALIIARNRL